MPLYGRSVVASPSDSPSSAHVPRRVVPFILSGTMLVVYLGFILLVAYDKPLLGQTITPGLSWGILLGALVIVATWGITFICVRVADAEEDRGQNL